MGLMRLLVANRDRVSDIDPARVFMAGMDELPWYGHVLVSGQQLVIQRAESDSGFVSMPWKVEGHGEVMLCTATLMERSEAYLLEVELARGLIQRIRNQLAQWEMMGLAVSPELRTALTTATTEFARAATRQRNPEAALPFANSAIKQGVTIASQLAEEYARQALTARLSASSRLGTLAGVELGDELPDEPICEAIAKAFNLVAMPFSWRSIEPSEGKQNFAHIDAQLQWAQKADLRTLAGPLLEFNESQLPDWLYLWEGDSQAVGKFMLEHLKSVVDRYKGKVHLWHVSSRMNLGRTLRLAEEERLQIVAQAVRTVRQLDQRTPVIVSVDQPWAEYMANQQTDLAPWHYADALVRADLGISALGLEINIGSKTDGTTNRTPLAFSRLIDQWALFDLPLVISLSVAEDATAESTAEWIEHHMPLLLAKNCVQLVVWNRLVDGNAKNPSAGLFTYTGHAKPALGAWQALREQLLT